MALNVLVWALHGPARVLERGVALRVRRSVADRLYVRLSQAPLTWHDRHHSGDLQHRIGQASRALFRFTQTQFIYLQNLIHLVGPLLALWLISTLTGSLIGFLLAAAAAWASAAARSLCNCTAATPSACKLSPWSFINAISGETTTVRPFSSSAGNW